MTTDTHQTTLAGDAPTRVGHCRKDNCTVYIGRGNGGDATMMNTPIGTHGWLGNPFLVETHGRTQCIDWFRMEFEKRLAEDPAFRAAIRGLSGEILGCWCQRVTDDGPQCHGEVVAEWADRLATESEHLYHVTERETDE